MKARRTLLFVFFLTLTILLVGEVQSTALDTDGVLNALEQKGEALVLIKLKDPDPLSIEPRLRKQQITKVQMHVLAGVEKSDFEVIYRYKMTCGIAGWLRPRGLEILSKDPNVERIYLDTGGRAHLIQSVPLIQADMVQKMGLSGNSVVVVVLDTGVDTDHPNLADGDIIAQNCFLDANQNQNCDGNSAEDDNGHGTNVASIITSNGTQGGKGVAPDADIVAIKCLDSGGVFWMADVVAALDWINDDYADTARVDIINMSIGTYALYSSAAAAEAAWPNLTQELNYARNTKGIIPFASSGNNGSSTAISAPAALSSVVSVGAVYDSDIGSYTWSGVCTDNTTAEDKVACWSNTCSILDLLAPGCKITTSWMGGGIGWWCGTSQACPHAVGTVALMLECDSSLTPNQIESYLDDYGEDVTDPKNNLTFPRINALRVMEQIIPTIWVEDFNDCDISDWEVHVSDGIFSPTGEQFVSPPCGLKMVSQSTGYAYGKTPDIDLIDTLDYTISFWFKLPNSNNHWFMVMDNSQIHLVIDYGTDLKTWDGVSAQLVKTLSVDQWYFIKCEVHPSVGNYVVYVDGDSLKTANFFNPEAYPYLRIGDIHTGSIDHGEGFWDDIRVETGTEVGVEEVESVTIVPQTYSLSQNYPNPFNPVTQIKFALPKDCWVKLEIYNMLGQKMTSLVDGEQKTGYKTARWDASTLSSGIYFYRLQAGDFVQTRKMILLK